MKATIYSVTCGGRSRRVSRSELAAMLRAWRAQGAYIELLGASRFRVTAASSYDVRAVA